RRTHLQCEFLSVVPPVSAVRLARRKERRVSLDIGIPAGWFSSHHHDACSRIVAVLADCSQFRSSPYRYWWTIVACGFYHSRLEREKRLTRRQSQRPWLSRRVLSHESRNETPESTSSRRTRRASHGRGSSLTFGK